MACGSAEELMALAKAEGMELTKEAAEAYLAELSVRDLDDGEMQAVAGGGPLICDADLCDDYLNK